MPEMSIRQNAPTIQVYLLGPPRIVVYGRELPKADLPRNRALLVLQCLLTRPNRRIAEDELAEQLFVKSNPDDVRSTIGATLSAIRRALGWSLKDGTAGLLHREHGIIAVLPEAGVWVDADEFEQLLRAAKTADDPYPLLEEANRLYAGEYLPAVRDALWCMDRRRHLKGLWVELQLQLAQLREERGDRGAAAAALEAVLREDPCDEHAARELMQVYARSDRRTDALRIFPRLEKSLKDDLGVEPSRETVEVWKQISSGSPPPAPPAMPAAPNDSRASGAAPTSSRRVEDRLDPSQFAPSYPFPSPERLVGRESELAFLEKLVQQGRTGAQVALVGAPAGTGKSALLGALVQRARRAGFLCLVGGGYEEEGIVPLGPFHDALSDYLLWLPAERVRAELAGALSDLTLLVPELRYHLGLPDRPGSDPSGDNSRIFGSILVYLLGLTERHPVLLCLEDLHAADAATLALIERLARQMSRQRLVILGTFRTEELRPGRPLSDLVTALRRRNAEQLDLKPLTRQRTGRMIAALLEGQPSERLSEALFSTTEGNPLFVEQLVLALREEGKIDQQDGIWRQIGDISGVPTIVRGVVGQRLDRLSDSARQTLEMAAILGQSFEYGGLLAASERDDEMRLLDDLDEAFGAQILLETATGYAFGHALLREVAYAQISPPRQMMLHARAGEALERWAGARADERAAELAYHFSHGGHSTAIRQKSLHYSLEAGRRADALSAHREALAHFAQVCALIERDSTLATPNILLDALDGRGESERNLADWGGCIATGRQIVALSADRSRRARAHNMIGRALLQTGDHAGAIAQFEAGLVELQGAPPGPDNMAARLHLMYQQTFPIFLQGRPDVGLRLGEQMLALAEELGQPRFLSNAHSVVAIAHMRQGRAERGETHYKLAQAAAERIANKLVLAFVHENLGAHYYYFGNFAEAHREIELGRSLVLDAAGEQRSILSFRFLALVLLAEGDLEGAFRQNDIAYKLALESNDRLVGECCEVLGIIHSARAQWEAAESCFEQALSTFERVENARAVPDALLGLGLVYERQCDWSRAETLYRRALDLTSRMDHPIQAVAAHRHLGQVLQRRASPSGRDHVERACSLAQTMPGSLEGPPAFLTMAEIVAPEDPADALALAERALEPAPTAEHLVEARLFLATLCAGLGRQADAHAHASAGVNVAERLDAPRPLGLAHLALGRALRPDPSARAHLEAAIQQFDLARTPFERELARAELSSLTH